jgi:dephospho-CoA kinase
LALNDRLALKVSIQRIGLTGGIGSGKSSVARFWVALGAHLVDTDEIARAISGAGGAALPALRQEFGDDAIDDQGALNRDGMRERAFADSSLRRRLESILHPMIGAEALRQAAALNSAAVVFDIPLLTASSPWRARCDRIAVVDCSEETQIERVTRRSGWSAEQVRRVIAQQAPRDARRAIADAVIDNDHDHNMGTLQIAAHALWGLWVVAAGADKPL